MNLNSLDPKLVPLITSSAATVKTTICSVSKNFTYIVSLNPYKWSYRTNINISTSWVRKLKYKKTKLHVHGESGSFGTCIIRIQNLFTLFPLYHTAYHVFLHCQGRKTENERSESRISMDFAQKNTNWVEIGSSCLDSCSKRSNPNKCYCNSVLLWIIKQCR